MNRPIRAVAVFTAVRPGLGKTAGVGPERRTAVARAVALGAVLVELAGVVGVGLWTVLDPGMFAHDTVWSRFGAGYGYVPLVLPVVGLIMWAVAAGPFGKARL